MFAILAPVVLRAVGILGTALLAGTIAKRAIETKPAVLEAVDKATRYARFVGVGLAALGVLVLVGDDR